MRALSGGSEGGGGGKSKQFCQEIGQRSQIPKMCNFKILAWKVKTVQI